MYIYNIGGLCLLIFIVFQRGFVAFVASVDFVCVWLLWLYHALPCFAMLYLSIYLSIYISIYLPIYLI